MMNQTIKIVNPGEIRRVGTEALMKALGPIGMARYLEEYDNGGQGDYTKEKYEQPDCSIEEILAMKFDEEEVMRSYIKSERYEAAQEAEQNKAKKTAIRMIKAGKMSLEDIADYTELPLDLVQDLQSEIMQLA